MQTFLAFFKWGLTAQGNDIARRLRRGRAGSDGVAGFGDAALAAFIARGVLAGNQAQIVHQLGGMGEAVEVAEFGDEGGGVEEGERTPSKPGQRVPNASRAWPGRLPRRNARGGRRLG